jgi:hypothetical protein
MMQDHLENLHHLMTYFHQLFFHHSWDVSEEMLAIEDKPKLEICLHHCFPPIPPMMQWQ